jgi:hypothetical protein
MIIEIEESLGLKNSDGDFYKELTGQVMNEDDVGDDAGEEDGQGDESYIGTAGQDFRNTLMAHLLRALAQ